MWPFRDIPADAGDRKTLINAIESLYFKAIVGYIVVGLLAMLTAENYYVVGGALWLLKGLFGVIVITYYRYCFTQWWKHLAKVEEYEADQEATPRSS